MPFAWRSPFRQVSGPLSIANGGTGASNSDTALANFVNSGGQFVIDFGTIDYGTLSLVNSSSGAGGPEISFFQNSSSPLAGDDIGAIRWIANDSGGGVQEYASIFIEPDNVTPGTEAGKMNFYLTTGGVAFGTASSVTTTGFRSGGGIQFNGDTAAANLLDDYEEGSFATTFTTTGVAYGTMTMFFGAGVYTKIGNLVHFQIQMATSVVTHGSATGNVRISGLPFTCSAVDHAVSVSKTIYNWPANKNAIHADVVASTNTIALATRAAVDGTSTQIAATDLTAGTNSNFHGTWIAGTYLTA